MLGRRFNVENIQMERLNSSGGNMERSQRHLYGGSTTGAEMQRKTNEDTVGIKGGVGTERPEKRHESNKMSKTGNSTTQ